MHRKTLNFILMIFCLLFWASPSIASDNEYQRAIDAYKLGDYKATYKLILPLAEKGIAQAQYNLGVMYFNGKGVEKDYSHAIKWWNLAANQGNDKAQYILGVMYEEGKGVKKNLKTAKTWFQLASNQGLAKAREKLTTLLNKTKGHLQENTTSSNELKSSKELKKIYTEIQDLQTTNASLRSELNQIKSEKTKAIEATNQANAETKQERLENLKELKKSYKGIKELQIATASLRSELNQIKSEKTKAIEATNQANAEAKREQLESLKELKISYKEIKNLQTTNASLHSELNQIKSEKTKAIEATNQTNAKTKQRQLESLKELKKSYKEIKDLQKTNASLQSKLNQIKLEKTKTIEATNQTNAKAKQKQLESLKELKKGYKEIKDLQTINASLQSKLNQIKLEKTKTIEATNQINTVEKQEQLETLKELKKGYKKIKDLQTKNASLRSELNQIKSEKTKAIEATNQTNTNTKQGQIASISDKPSELDTGSVTFPEDAFNIDPYNEDTITKTDDYINDSDRLHTAIDSLRKKEFSLARELFFNLADKGMPEAQINLGMMFENGQGVPQNFKKAIRWYRLAADQGLTKAQKKLSSLLKISPTAQINFDLGMRFERGQGVPEDFREAIRFYRLAADLGHIKAQEKINLILSGQLLEQIKSKKTSGIKATNQAKITEENLAIITEQDFTEAKGLHTAVTSLQSELEQIKSDKIRANEVAYQANAKAKKDKLASIKKFENLKKESFKEIKALQVKTEFLRSELDKIKSDKVRAIEASNQAKSKIDTMITSKELMSSYLNHWVHSWEKKDIKMYFSFYSKDFKGTKERHVDWRISRQAAIKTHTNISIQLKNIQISKSKNTIEINFTQIFKSAGYSDIGLKELVWAKTGNDWRIIEETWIPYQSLSNIGK